MSDDIKRTIIDAATKFNLSPATMLSIAKRESSFNPNARNPNSTAGGLFQFIDGTWSSTVAKYGKMAGVAPDATKFDIKSASLMASALAVENKTVIKNMVGRDATEGEVYLAHFLGGRQAVNMILAKDNRPDAPAAALFPAEATSNPTIFYDKDGQPRSVAQVYNRMASIDAKAADDVTAVTAQSAEPAKQEKTAAADDTETVRIKPIDYAVSPAKAAPPVPQKIAGAKGPEIESEIERVATRVGARKGLMG